MANNLKDASFYKVSSAKSLSNNYSVQELKNKKSSYKEDLQIWKNRKNDFIKAKEYAAETKYDLKTTLDYLSSSSSLLLDNYTSSSGTTQAQTKLDDTISTITTITDFLSGEIINKINSCLSECNSVIDVIEDGIIKIQEAIDICNSKQEILDN